jgi:predicted Zn-dependent protease
MKSIISRQSRALAVFGAMVFLCSPFARAASSEQPQTVSPQEENWEVQMGQRQYQQYAQRGEIVPPQSPLYGVLDPIGNAIAAVANQEYFAPFHFILLNEPTPNAFSMPGGNVYVTTSMLQFLKNKDGLAGVLCHEVNHDIHHDMYNVYQASQGAPGAGQVGYERATETNADRAGAYTCAKAGFNPWGMVWNMRQHSAAMGAGPQGPSNHPGDDQRLADLVTLFASDPATFGRFRDDVAASTPLAVPYAQSAYARPQYSQQGYPQQGYPQQGYPQQQYPQQQYPQPQYPLPQYPQPQYPQNGAPYPPPPLPACYPRC